MREINLFVEDWVNPVFSPRKKVGRPGKTRIAVQAPEFLPSDFYLTISNLSDSEMDSFIRTYQLTAPFRKHDGLATKEDLHDFQDNLNFIAKSIKNRKSILKLLSRYSFGLTPHLVHRKTSLIKDNEEWDLLSMINSYLSDSHLEFGFPPVLQQHLSSKDAKSLSQELSEMDSEKEPLGLLKENVLKQDVDGKKAGNIPVLKIRTSHLLSWCVLCLLVDALFRKRNFGVCKNCETLFIPKQKNQPYCTAPACKTTRDAKRKRDSRAINKLRTK